MEESDKPTWFDRLLGRFVKKPDDKDALIGHLRTAHGSGILDGDALTMIEGVLTVSEMQVRDIMVPRAQMDVVDANDQPDEFIPFVIEAAHSRFPVVDGSKDNVVGILLAKDLLRYHAGEDFNTRSMLRPAIFIPESKRLNVLLKEFRSSRNHIAIVVDEYGGVAGLVTIEDVLEQIVGDIEDEYDFDEEGDAIIYDRSGVYRVKATAEIEEFNRVLGTELSDADCDTVGGLVARALGHMPKRGEQVFIDGVRFVVVRADSRRIHSLKAERVA